MTQLQEKLVKLRSNLDNEMQQKFVLLKFMSHEKALDRSMLFFTKAWSPKLAHLRLSLRGARNKLNEHIGMDMFGSFQTVSL